MDVYSVREALKTKSIYDIPLRVTFYARVSTDSDAQLNSLENQMKFFTDYIKQSKYWIYVDGYIDEGISGITTTKRENFNLMINDALEGKFDLIITKEITRFARNTVDSIQYTRELLSNGVAVIFLNDNINTLDPDSELRLTIMAGIAQDEVRRLSSRIKFGHQQAIKRGVVLGNGRIFGYKKENKRLVIDEEQAIIVRKVFELYATGNYGLKEIERILWDEGYRNHNGKRIGHTTLSGIISNPKYKGYYVGNKVKIIDMFTKKQKFLPPEEWVMYKDETGEIVPAIVSEELWDAANEILKRRSEDVKKRRNICNHSNLLTGKLYCTHCNVPYYRKTATSKDGTKNSRWICSNKYSNGAQFCDSFTIYESDIVPILFDVFKNMENNIDKLIDEYVQMFEQILNPENVDKKIDALKKKIELSQKKKNKLLEYNITGKISDADFLNMNKQCDDEISKYNQAISDLQESSKRKEEFKKRIDSLKKSLQTAKSNAINGIIDRNFVEKFIDKIYATPLSRDEMKLEIQIFSGEILDRSLINLRGSTGHISKKMTPVRHFQITRINRRLWNHEMICKFTYSVTI